MERLSVLAVITVLMYIFVRQVPPQSISHGAAVTMSFGFIILAAYLLAGLFARLKLPKITGYIIAGILLGPSLLGLLGKDVVTELRLIDDLALTFIALAAGGELRLGMLRERRWSIIATLTSLLLVVFFGVTFSLFALRSFFPFTGGLGTAESIALVAISGAIAVARSPSSVIAIISETRARGPFTEMVLGVTVALDVMAIFLFAIVLSIAEVILSEGREFNIMFIGGIASEVAASVVLGLLLGKGIALYLERVRTGLTIFTLGVAFLITKLSHALAALLDANLGVHFHLEPMLICLTAGFVVQNFSREGAGFMRVIDRSSLPIYVIFFAMSGAGLELAALRTTWYWALVLVGLRALFVYLGGIIGGTLARDPIKFRRVSGLSFLTQAGVSLGLVKLMMDRLPDFGPSYATLLVATITINQVIGPVGFKSALNYVGESRLFS